MVKCDFKNDPRLHIQEKAPSDVAEPGSDSPVLHLLSSSCFLTFIKASGSSPSTPSCARLWSFPGVQGPCFSWSARLENPVMKDLPIYAFPFLAETLRLYAALKAALMGYGLALTAHLDAKQTPGRLHSMPSVHMRVNDVHRSHSK